MACRAACRRAIRIASDRRESIHLLSIDCCSEGHESHSIHGLRNAYGALTSVALKEMTPGNRSLLKCIK